MIFNIDYEHAIDFGHCETMDIAREKLSELTNILNKIIVIRQRTKKDILEACSTYHGENIHKLSWDNKLIRLAELSESSELVNLWQEADMAYRQVKNKQSQVLEDLLSLKKMIDITPR